MEFWTDIGIMSDGELQMGWQFIMLAVATLGAGGIFALAGGEAADTRSEAAGLAIICGVFGLAVGFICGLFVVISIVILVGIFGLANIVIAVVTLVVLSLIGIASFNMKTGKGG